MRTEKEQGKSIDRIPKREILHRQTKRILTQVIAAGRTRDGAGTDVSAAKLDGR